MLHLLDKNGVEVNVGYEGNITDIKDEQMATGIWHRFVTTKEQDKYGGTIERKYLDGRITDLTRTVASHPPWTDPLSHP